MTNLFFLLITGMAVGFSGAIIPGPLTLFTVSEVLKSDRHVVPKIILGHITIEFLFIGIVFLGLHKFLSSGIFLSAMSIVGGLALLAMGVILALHAPKMKLLHKKTNNGFNKGLFIGGIFFSAISPGFLVWWATIGVSTLVRAFLFGVAGVAVLTLGHWLADIIWHWSLSYAVDKSKTHLNEKSYQNIIRLLSILLMILGLYFVGNNWPYTPLALSAAN